MEIYIAHTQGFCAGVASAIEVVQRALAKYGTPLYVYHDIVHNTSVVNEFKRRGVIFIEELTDVPTGSRIIFSAHGIPPLVLKEAKQRNLKFIDATCPLVTKVHDEAIHFSKKKIQTILIGHKGHQEMVGTAGYVSPTLLHIVEDEDDIEQLDMDTDQPVGYLTQTTLSVTDTEKIIDKLQARFPKLMSPPRKDICYATQNRQDAVKDLAKTCDLIVICGSPHSSNSNRLRETGEQHGVPCYIVDTADEFDLSLLNGHKRLGISSGASVPRYIVEELVQKIKTQYPRAKIHTSESPEANIVFRLPVI